MQQIFLSSLANWLHYVLANLQKCMCIGEYFDHYVQIVATNVFCNPFFVLKNIKLREWSNLLLNLAHCNQGHIFVQTILIKTSLTFPHWFKWSQSNEPMMTKDSRTTILFFGHFHFLIERIFWIKCFAICY